MNLDTEIVLVVQSPQLAAQFLDAFAIGFAPGTPGGSPTSSATTTSPGHPAAPRPLVEPHDPASAWRRIVRSIERILPIAFLL
jgi:hypothetical protein